MLDCYFFSISECVSLQFTSNIRKAINSVLICLKIGDAVIDSPNERRFCDLFHMFFSNYYHLVHQDLLQTHLGVPWLVSLSHCLPSSSSL